MKSSLLVNSGFEELALQEIKELIGVKGKLGSGIIEFDTKEKDLIYLCAHGQSFKSVLVELDKNSNLDKIKFSRIVWKDFFWKEASFKIEVEGVKGNEKRIEISKKVGKEIFDQTKELNLKLDYKKPEILVKVYFDGKEYFIGIDLCGFDLTKRHYRVFVNSASLKGDLAYYLLRKSGFVKGEKVLICFVKDGVLAIESALFNSNGIVNKIDSKLPILREIELSQKKKETKTKVYSFDESSMNIRSAKKNSKIAGTDEFLELNKFDLDEIDVKFSENEIDRLIFHITRKDEDKLNEIYYQANYVLKKKGTLLLFGRKNWEVSISDKFKLISEEKIERGDSCLKVWLLEKR